MRRISAAVSCAAAALALLVTGAPGAQAVSSTDTTAASAFVCSSSCILGVRTGSHPDFDRLVIDVSEDGMPSVDHLVTADNSYGTPSGQDQYIQIPGKMYLHLNLFGAHTYDDTGAPTYSSPQVVPVSLPSLKGVQLLTDYEGYVNFGLSLGDYSRYQVFTLKSPNRIVVDVYH